VTRPESIPASVRLDFVLLARLQRVAQSGATTEAELRSIWERTDAWVRMIEGQIEGCERRLRHLADRSSPLAAITAEVRRVEVLQPRLDEVRSLLSELERRAPELRSASKRESSGELAAVTDSGER
jgi:predicted RNase H-like nuclease (RuvC/YqgF family)